MKIKTFNQIQFIYLVPFIALAFLWASPKAFSKAHFSAPLSVQPSVPSSTILNWDNSIPLTAESVSTLLIQKADEHSYSDDGLKCGGEIFDPYLKDYFTTIDFDGAETVYIDITFRMSFSFDFCRSEVLLQCSARVTLESDRKTASLSPIHCPEFERVKALFE